MATASGFGILIAVPSVALLLFLQIEDPPPFTIGSVSIPAFLPAVVTTPLTAPYGAALAHKTDAARLKRYFSLFLLLVGINMLRKAIWT